MSLIYWMVDTAFDLFMWMLLDPNGKCAFWFIEFIIIASSIILLYKTSDKKQS